MLEKKIQILWPQKPFFYQFHNLYTLSILLTIFIHLNELIKVKHSAMRLTNTMESK